MLKRKANTKKPHQLEALKKIKAYYKSKKRGKLIMPCGTGKTLIGYWTMIALDSMTVVVAVPNIHLVGQALKDWRTQSSGEGVDISFLCVCSDETVSNEPGSTKELKARNSDVQVTTDAAEISSWIKSTKGARRVIFTTYQSSDVVCAALKRKKVDLIVFDEAHRTTGSDDKLFSIMLSDDNIKASKRLYMTATERFYTGVKDNVLSMDDVEIYGDVIYSMSFKYAIENNLLCDYRIVTLAVTKQDLLAVCQENRTLKDSDKNVSDEAVMIASMIAVRRLMDKEGLSNCIAYTNTIDRARRFAGLAEVDIGTKSIESFHISGEMSGCERNGIMKRFTNSDKAIIANAKCLQEGIDISGVDCVAFVDPKKSTVDTVQSSGRALRLHDKKKMAYIVIPVFLDADGNMSDHQKAYEPAVRMISSLASVDERIVEQFSSSGQDRPGGDSIVQHRIDDDEITSCSISELMTHLSEITLKSTRKLSGYATLDDHRKWCSENGIKHTVAYRKAKIPWNFYVCPLTAFGLNSSDFFEKKKRVVFVPMQECQEWCKANGIDTAKKYKKAVKPFRFPSTPWVAYKVTYYEFFGKQDRSFAPVEEVVLWWVKNKIRSIKHFNENRPSNFPSKPWLTYKISSSEFYAKIKEFKPVKALSKEMFGREVSAQTVSRWNMRGNAKGIKLKVIKVGGRVLTTRDWMMEYVSV